MNGFHPERISYEEHCRWFEEMTGNEAQMQYILMAGGDAAGQVRISVEGGCAEVHYSIAPEKRNMGLGRMLVKLVRETVCREYPGVHKMIAKVKPGNMASMRCFEENGFRETFIQYESEKKDYDPVSGGRE